MNAKSILIAALVALGTLSFPATADARPRYRHKNYRAYPQHYNNYQHYRYPRQYYYSRPQRYYGHGYNYYDPYRYRRGTGLYLQYGPLTIRRWR